MIIRFKRGQNGNYSWEIEIDKAKGESLDDVVKANNDIMGIYGD